MKRIRQIALLLALCGTLSLHASNWMYRLPDNAYVAVLSIPGTHDSATGCGWGTGWGLLGDPYATTQDLDISAQWAAGVRAFDFRPCLYDGYMNMNHGLVPTKMHFEDALRLLRDSLLANPSEFAVIHVRHESDGDQTDDSYEDRLRSVLTASDLSDFLASFKSGLTVGEMRGKMLLLSRDKYTNPIGGYILNWTSESNWNKQILGRIVGTGSQSASLYMQDYYDAHNSGGQDVKIAAVKKLLDFSTQHATTTVSSIRWILNFASAYSKATSFFGQELSLSDGYRDNAVHVHQAVLDYLSANPAGPVGIMLMDFVGVDQSGSYAVHGQELVNAIIENNFRYLHEETTAVHSIAAPLPSTPAYTLSGTAPTSSSLRRGAVRLVRGADGRVRKYVAR